MGSIDTGCGWRLYVVVVCFVVVMDESPRSAVVTRNSLVVTCWFGKVMETSASFSPVRIDLRFVRLTMDGRL